MKKTSYREQILSSHLQPYRSFGKAIHFKSSKLNFTVSANMFSADI